MTDYNPKTYGGIMIMGANGWRPIEPPNVTPAPHDKTWLEVNGLRQEVNQAEYDFLWKAYVENQFIGEQQWTDFIRALEDIRHKPLSSLGLVFKDGRQFKPAAIRKSVTASFFGKKAIIPPRR